MTSNRIYFTLIIILIGFSSCKKYDKKGNIIKDYDELYKANWLLGEWERKDSIGTLKEIWESEDDSTFVGQSYFIINKNDTVHNEQIELMQDKEHLIYTATVEGENNGEPVPFQMTKDDDSLMVFENPKHDFPQKIEYQLKKDNTLVATVSGKIKGIERAQSYPMTKKK